MKPWHLLAMICALAAAYPLSARPAIWLAINGYLPAQTLLFVYRPFIHGGMPAAKKALQADPAQ